MSTRWRTLGELPREGAFRNPGRAPTVGCRMTVSGIDSSALRAWDRIASGAVAERPASRPQRPLLGRVLRRVAWVVVIAVLPFIALVRVAVFLYVHEGWATAVALGAGAACTAVIVTGYAAWAWYRLTGRLEPGLVARRVAIPLVLAYCGYGLVYLSSANAKSAEVRHYYTALHPLLRIALSTVMLADRDLVVTDLARRPEDYRTMRLPVNDGSLHYVQKDGYSHAADLRTEGRNAITSRLVQVYFWAMGFGTLRHVGTADHLHVELPVH